MTQQTNVQVLHKKPDIYEELKEKFGIDWDDGIIITYYPHVYCKFELPPDKLVHEAVHLKQQSEMGPVIWWHKFIKEPGFRLEQEVEAHRREAAFIRKSIKDRNVSFRFLRDIAINLSSSIYGKLITFDQAVKLLKS